LQIFVHGVKIALIGEMKSLRIYRKLFWALAVAVGLPKVSAHELKMPVVQE